jgi:hypothetical protein
VSASLPPGTVAWFTQREAFVAEIRKGR